MGNILVYGGTFDPPHEGHVNLLNAAVQARAFQRIILIPSYIPPHKLHSPALPFELRKALLLNRFAHLKGVEVSDLEQCRAGKSYTVDTLGQLQELYPDDTIHFLMGSDMFLSFERWRAFETLLKGMVLVVGSREAGDFEALESHRKHLLECYECKGIILCREKAVECSSTALREVGEGLAGRIFRHIGEQMDVKRACHTFRVAEYARKLAPRFGLDAEKAYLAGLMHDVTRCFSAEWQLDYADKAGISLTEEDRKYPHILHQFTGEAFIRENFGVTDPELLSAVACHTTGKEKMSLFDMLIFFADSCEPGRNYPGVETLRRIGEQDLKKGTLAVLKHTTAYIKEKGDAVHSKTATTLMDLQKELLQDE